MTFGQRWTPPPRLRDQEREPQRLVREVSFTGTTYPVPPKPEPTRPGKGNPTLEESEWMDWISGYGCVACKIDGLGFRPAAVHHLLRAGRRMGHLFTIPLCDPGHHQNGGEHYPSRHPWKKRFEAKYGTEMELLTRLRAEKGAQ